MVSDSRRVFVEKRVGGIYHKKIVNSILDKIKININVQKKIKNLAYCVGRV